MTNIDIKTAGYQKASEIMVEGIKEALKKSKNKKASGLGNIPIELVKYGPIYYWKI